MKKFNYLFIIIAAWVASCNPYSSKIPTELVGCYLDSHTGEWKYGLYEEFAIYQNDFWDYESVSDNQIVLSKKSGEKAVLNLAIPDSCERIIYNHFDEVEVKVPVLTINGDTTLNFFNDRGNGLGELSFGFYCQLFDGIKPDTTTFKKHSYDIDTAVVRIYIRNSAKGMSALSKREQNRTHSIQVFNYLEAKNASAKPIDSTDHYGYRYEIKIPVTGVSELPMTNLFINKEYNSFANGSVNYVVEPGDTLIFFYSEDYGGGIGAAVDIYRGIILCGGDNQRFNYEKNGLTGGQISNQRHYISEHHYYDQERKLYKLEKIDTVYADMCPFYDLQRRNVQRDTLINRTPISDKYYQTYLRKLQYLKYLEMMNHFEIYDDTLKAIFPLNEDEIFSTITAYNFVINYFEPFIFKMPSTPENLEQHPDWIVAESYDSTKILDPLFIKTLGFSNDFVEFYRLMQAVQFYDDFSPIRGLKDFELQSVMNNLTREDYRIYLQDKINNAK